jgi:hypothetical protein
MHSCPTSETFLCSTFTLQLKTVLLLDVLQLLMLSAGTLMSLQDIMFHLNIFYCKQDTAYMLSIYLIICVHNFIIIITIIISCHKFSFFPGTSPLELVVNPTTQASSLSL